MINLEGALQQEDRFTDWLVHASKAVIIKYMCLLKSPITHFSLDWLKCVLNTKP